MTLCTCDMLTAIAGGKRCNGPLAYMVVRMLHSGCKETLRHIFQKAIPFAPDDEGCTSGYGAWQLQEKLMAEQFAYGNVWPFLAGGAVCWIRIASLQRCLEAQSQSFPALPSQEIERLSTRVRQISSRATTKEISRE